jgi:IS1 family transposase
MDALERENLELRQKLARLAEPSPPDASGPLGG